MYYQRRDESHKKEFVKRLGDALIELQGAPNTKFSLLVAKYHIHPITKLVLAQTGVIANDEIVNRSEGALAKAYDTIYATLEKRAFNKRKDQQATGKSLKESESLFDPLTITKGDWERILDMLTKIATAVTLLDQKLEVFEKRANNKIEG